jgi:hypothetical protein
LFKKLISFELLFHNLALLLLVPGSKETQEEAFNDIEELKICYLKMGLAGK